MFHLLAATLIAALESSEAVAAPTPPTSCTTERAEARIVKAAPVDYPQSASLTKRADKAFIQVVLSDSGRVVGTSVVKSSGSFILDRAAIDAVASSVYAPAADGCGPVPGSYAVEVDFDD